VIVYHTVDTLATYTPDEYSTVGSTRLEHSCAIPVVSTQPKLATPAGSKTALLTTQLSPDIYEAIFSILIPEGSFLP
jgi:hypothetical protein